MTINNKPLPKGMTSLIFSGDEVAVVTSQSKDNFSFVFQQNIIESQPSYSTLLESLHRRAKAHPLYSKSIIRHSSSADTSSSSSPNSFDKLLSQDTKRNNNNNNNNSEDASSLINSNLYKMIASPRILRRPTNFSRLKGFPVFDASINNRKSPTETIKVHDEEKDPKMGSDFSKMIVDISKKQGIRSTTTPIPKKSTQNREEKNNNPIDVIEISTEEEDEIKVITQKNQSTNKYNSSNNNNDDNDNTNNNNDNEDDSIDIESDSKSSIGKLTKLENIIDKVKTGFSSIISLIKPENSTSDQSSIMSDDTSNEEHLPLNSPIDITKSKSENLLASSITNTDRSDNQTESIIDNEEIDLTKCLFHPSDIDVSFENFPYCYLW